MSKLPMVDSKTFEKLLLTIGFKLKRHKGSHHFTDIRTVDTPLYRIMQTEILVVH